MKDKLNQILRNIMNLLAARDKELWSGSNWTEGEKTIPGIDDYSVISVNVYSYSCEILMRRNGGLFVGICASSSDTAFNTARIMLTNTGEDTYKMDTYSIQHTPSGGHSAIIKAVYGITRIVGVEPIRSKILSGGGRLLRGILAACRALLGGVRHEIDVKRHLEKTHEKERRHGLGQLAFVQHAHGMDAGRHGRPRESQKSWKSGGTVNCQPAESRNRAAERIQDHVGTAPAHEAKSDGRCSRHRHTIVGINDGRDAQSAYGRAGDHRAAGDLRHLCSRLRNIRADDLHRVATGRRCSA